MEKIEGTVKPTKRWEDFTNGLLMFFQPRPLHQFSFMSDILLIPAASTNNVVLSITMPEVLKPLYLSAWGFNSSVIVFTPLKILVNDQNVLEGSAVDGAGNPSGKLNYTTGVKPATSFFPVMEPLDFRTKGGPYVITMIVDNTAAVAVNVQGALRGHIAAF